MAREKRKLTERLGLSGVDFLSGHIGRRGNRLPKHRAAARLHARSVG